MLPDFLIFGYFSEPENKLSRLLKADVQLALHDVHSGPLGRHAVVQHKHRFNRCMNVGCSKYGLTGSQARGMAALRPYCRNVHGAAIGPLPFPITVANGPLRTFIFTSQCWGAARQTGLSLRSRNQLIGELTVRGTELPDAGVAHASAESSAYRLLRNRTGIYYYFAT